MDNTQPPISPTLVRYYKAFCIYCGDICHVTNSTRVGGICFNCEHDNNICVHNESENIAG